MANINEIAQAIGQETEEQGEKLTKLDEHITVADENVEKGVENLHKARKYQKSSGRCMYFLIAIIFICLIVIGCIYFFSWYEQKDTFCEM